MENETLYLVRVAKLHTLTKPDKQTAARITCSMVEQQLSADQLKKALLNGSCIGPAIFDETDDRFVEQQLFFIDVDSGRSVKANIQLCEQLQLPPLLVYATMSFTSENQKHRLVFAMKDAITELNERNEILSGLVTLFGGDHSTENVKRIFYPGIVSFFYNPYDTIEVGHLKEVLSHGINLYHA